jgi:diacylglycerol O-acyltransferase / wax synthase
VRVAHLPDPGDQAQLLLAIEQLRARRLDRSRPLWEICFLPGLPDARIGMFIRLHHVIADGIAGVAGLGSLLDAAPTPPQHQYRPGHPHRGQRTVSYSATTSNSGPTNWLTPRGCSRIRRRPSGTLAQSGPRCANSSPSNQVPGPA